MTELDTSAYTPADETEEQDEQEEVERTRFQIPLDQKQEYNLYKAIEQLEEQVRDNTRFQEKIDELRNLLEVYDCRKFLKMWQYECDKCGEIFDTKQGIGVHHKMNPNCNGEDRPWNTEEPTYTKIRVEDNERS